MTCQLAFLGALQPTTATGIIVSAWSAALTGQSPLAGPRETPAAELCIWFNTSRHMKHRHGGEFSATLIQYPGKGGWTFAPVPEKYALAVTHAWGRTPVRATVDGHVWETSVWRDKSGQTLLPVPRHVRGSKGSGDTVRVRIEFSGSWRRRSR